LKKTRKPESFVRLPKYPGGKTAFQKYIKQNLKYPKEALDNKIQGKVKVNYKVNTLGNVVEAEVTSGIGYGCDEEALRLVKGLVYEKAKNRGVKVLASMNAVINFVLPKVKPKQVINYTIVPQKEENQLKKEPEKKQGYTITVNF